MLILLDQDGVLADFEQGFHDAWNARHAALGPALSPSARKSFYVRDDYPVEHREVVESIYTAPGFFSGLLPMAGAVEGVAKLLSLGHDVRICTSPLNQWRYCISEKYEWVERHLGADFIHRMIVTKDKTLVHGDVLVDDKPHIKGSRKSAWRQVIFDQPYNRDAVGPRMTWQTWERLLAESAE